MKASIFFEQSRRSPNRINIIIFMIYFDIFVFMQRNHTYFGTKDEQDDHIWLNYPFFPLIDLDLRCNVVFDLEDV